MRLGRWTTMLGVGAICATAAFVAPALQAQEGNRTERSYAKRLGSLPRSGVGTFTPAAADPKLAAILARSGLPDSGFRFTPSESRRRGVTVAVRARSTRGTAVARNDVAAAAPVSLAPIAYNLGVSVGWKRFAVAGDVTRVELPTQPGSTERATAGVSYSGSRVTGRVQAEAERPLANTPVLIGDKPSYSIDVGGSYSLTRNLDVTAGVRYKSEQDRLPKMTNDNRRDSQAVYVGTAFRF
ncbi:hypothetical protein FHS95_003008 [Sphingomonas naasensis]|nr:hypothetical protein [Sphingomonas naasensis]NIJ21305.1 hypothetical protein [Sphingomonas naasensis]